MTTIERVAEEPVSPRQSVLQALAEELATRIANASKGIPWREGRLAAFTQAGQHGLAAVEQYHIDQEQAEIEICGKWLSEVTAELGIGDAT